MPMFTEIDPWRDEDYWPKHIGEDSLPKTPGAGKVEAAGIEPASHSLPNSSISRDLCMCDTLEEGWRPAVVPASSLPAYTEFIGRQLLAEVNARVAA